MNASPPFWRFLPDRAAPDAEAVRAAAASGKGALSRTLREARETLGAQRAAGLLKDVRCGRPMRLLVAAAFQPRAIRDALRVGFAIAGIDVQIREIDGFAALGEALRGDDAGGLSDVDMALVPLLGTDPTSVADLARDLARRCTVPVLVATTGVSAPVAARDGVEFVAVALSGPAVDARFGNTFGAIPTAEAAERISDAAAARAASLFGLAPKLLVTDLDGTLWTGILAEDGEAGIVLDTAYMAATKALAADGLLLAVASRNDPGDVDRVFAAHPEWPLGRHDFAAVAVGWEEKDALVASVLDKLGLAAEHMAFVDDDPVNCARVAARLPDADVRLVVGDREAFSRALAADPLLRGTGTSDGDRAAQYRRREAVERLRGEAADVSDFLRRLRSVVTVAPLEPSLLPRAAELASRVNQFALTGRRPNAAELARRASPLDFMVRLDDAFGAHGLVGLVLASVEGEAARVEAFFLSCRALGRGVETAMLAALGELAREAGCGRIVGAIEVLPRNEPARHCFSRYSDAPGGSSWTVRLDDGVAAPEGTTLRWARTTT